MTFTHNNKDDTILERNGSTIEFTFIGNPFTYEEQDHIEFNCTQEELLFKLERYFNHHENADIFDDLTIHGQDALWNALVTLEKHKQYL